MPDDKKPWRPRRPAPDVRRKQDAEYDEDNLLDDLGKVSEREPKPELDDPRSS